MQRYCVKYIVQFDPTAVALTRVSAVGADTVAATSGAIAAMATSAKTAVITLSTAAWRKNQQQKQCRKTSMRGGSNRHVSFNL